MTGWNKAHPPLSRGLSTAERAVFIGALWRAERRFDHLFVARRRPEERRPWKTDQRTSFSYKVLTRLSALRDDLARVFESSPS